MPVALGNAIKGKQEDFYKRLSLLTPEDILTAIPMVHPRTNPISDDIIGISRFPIEQAEREGRPELTETGWMVLARAIYRRNPTALRYIEHIFDPSLDDANLDASPDAPSLDALGAGTSSGSGLPQGSTP